MYEIYQDEEKCYLCTEFCEGGDLLAHICDKDVMKESEVLMVIYQLLEAVNYLHQNNICHRDIKPENILFSKKYNGLMSEIKLIDFGLSKILTNPDQILQTKIGTPLYIAPEVIKGSYNKQCDLWSIGVITYTLLCGYPPFFGETKNELLKKILFCDYEFIDEDW